jgi:hypothetical protein
MDKNMVNFALQEADRQGVPREYIKAIIMNESSGGINIGKSRAGAIGPMQLMPATAKEQGVNINDWKDNIRGGVMYFKKLFNQFDGDASLAAAAYNAGPGNVRKYGGIPPFKETRDYVRKFEAAIKPITKPITDVAKPIARSEPGKPLTLKLQEPTPFDVEAETESNFASLLSKIGMGGKRKRQTKKTPGILDGLF